MYFSSILGEHWVLLFELGATQLRHAGTRRVDVDGACFGLSLELDVEGLVVADVAGDLCGVQRDDVLADRLNGFLLKVHVVDAQVAR